MGKDLKGKELGKGLRQRSNGIYEARVSINNVSKSLYDRDLKKLKEELKRHKALVDAGLELENKKITLDEWFETWFESYKKPILKQSSINPSKTAYYTSFGKFLGTKKINQIKNMDIQMVLVEMKNNGRAVSSIKRALGQIRECLESAKNNGMIQGNPAFDIKVAWTNKSKEEHVLTSEEEETFLNAVKGNWYNEMFHTMFLTGMRVGEIGGLKWEDVDFKNKCIYIKRSLSCNYENGKKMMYLGLPKTTNSERMIPFMGNIEEVLLSQLDKQTVLKNNLSDRYRGKGEYENLVFTTSMGSPVIRHIAEKECTKIVTEINKVEQWTAKLENRQPRVFEKIHPHSIRHRFCSRCFEKGMNAKVVQEIVGHANYSTTIQIYTHVPENMIREEACKFDSSEALNDEVNNMNNDVS